MKVMVTGATTPLGRALIDHLVCATDVELVLAVGREPSAALPAAVLYEAVDLTRPRHVRDLVWTAACKHEIDTVVHLAHHRDPGDVGWQAHAQNVVAARELVLRCAEHPAIRRLVYRSFADVYSLDPATSGLLDEDAALELGPGKSQWLRDRVEADLTTCAHVGDRLQIAVLRCAELFAPDSGSQLWNYLSSRLCLRPLGFDPMINLLSLADAVTALAAAARTAATGVFNIPGVDTLPLSIAIAESLHADIAVPGPLLAPLYSLRRVTRTSEFRYGLSRRRLHIAGVLDGTRARRQLGYTPARPVSWPRPWWRTLLERLAASASTSSVR
jgi:UDP-glucose 4-epimerase